MPKNKKKVQGQPKFSVKSYNEYLKQRSRPSGAYKRLTSPGASVMDWMEKNENLIDEAMNEKTHLDRNGKLISIADMMKNLK